MGAGARPGGGGGDPAAGSEPRLRIELAWVDAEGRVALRPLDLPAGATLGDALASIDEPRVRDALTAGKLSPAVFGEAKAPAEPLFDGDRVELLEGLRVDPKVARQRRVAVRRAQAGKRG